MVKKYCILSACMLLATIKGITQNTGMLPITGIHYFKDGLSAKFISTKMNGQYLMNNRIPPNTAIEVNLQQLSGFTTDKKKNIFPAARYCLLSGKGDTILSMANLLLDHPGIGFTPKELVKGLSFIFSIKEGLVQPNSKCMIGIVLYDQLKNSQLRLEYPLVIAYPREPIFLSPAAPQILKSPPGSTVMAFGLSVKNIEFTVDTAISYNPKLAYMHLEVTKLGGVDVISMLQGKENYWVYDTLYKEINIKEKVLKDAGGAMGTGSVNCSIKIPFRLKKDRPKGYLVRYRWDGPDKT